MTVPFKMTDAIRDTIAAGEAQMTHNAPVEGCLCGYCTALRRDAAFIAALIKVARAPGPTARVRGSARIARKVLERFSIDWEA